MDDIILIPQQHIETAEKTSTSKVLARAKVFTKDLLAYTSAQAEVLQRQGSRVYHRVSSMVADKPLVGPLPFLAVSVALGLYAVTNFIYTPAYVLSVDGQNLGLVRSENVFAQVQSQVEARASDILGYDYALDHTITYEPALTFNDYITPSDELEAFLFENISDVSQNYVLTVDGVSLGGLTDEATLDVLLDSISAPYINENTISVTFNKDVAIAQEYIPSTEVVTADDLYETLTSNTNGQTTYEVKSGDTFMALAYANNMSTTEMQDLNADINIDRLYIGQILNVKEEIPLLGVQTVDAITYTEEIAPEIRQVEDDTMYKGDSKVLDAGIPGEARMTANVTYLNGIEKERNVTSTAVLSNPTEKVIAVGTIPRPTWYPTGSYIWPTYGKVTSAFGYRSIFGSYSYHSGIDISVSYGTAIKAADGGTVTFAGYQGSYGYLVKISHGNGEETYYAHNSSLAVNVGDKVYQGQTIAYAGSTGRSTGVHCHFELRINGTAVNPASYLK